MLTLVTSNPNKKTEVEAILVGVEISTKALELPEIQSMNLKEIVLAKARSAFAMVCAPVLVEDVSFEMECLNGFPGPFVKWWKQVVGYELALEIAKLENKYGATARCGSAYCNGDDVCYAEGVVKGRLTAKKGESGFGFDPYFIPEGHEKTFAQMSIEAKNGLSHRARAFKELRSELKAAGVI
jgi:non-canonical purine NTP pyrophosphatase (RdgB/HAM1 family)